MRDAIYIAIIAILCAIILSDQREVDEFVEIHDTVRVYMPAPISSSSQAFKVPLSWVIFPEREESPTDDAGVADSVVVEIERKTYADSLFSAEISGPRIGQLGPKLENITIYRDILTLPPRSTKRVEVGACAGALLKGRDADLWAGIEVRRVVGRFAYGGAVGYSLSGSPFVEARASFRIFEVKK